MLKYIKEFGKHVAIISFKNVKIRDTEKFLGKINKEKPENVEIQFFNARYLATWQHLYFAVLNALTAFKNRENISKSLAVETILYASAQRQIRKATEILGIKSDTSEIAALIFGENLLNIRKALKIVSKNINAKKDYTVLGLSKEKKKIIQKVFGISDLELQAVMEKDGLEKALTDLVIERMALLATRR